MDDRSGVIHYCKEYFGRKFTKPIKEQNLSRIQLIMKDLPGATDVISPVQLIFDETNLISFPCIAEKN